jgi:integrase
MPIRRRGGAWQIDVQVGGCRVRRTAQTKKAARELEAQLAERLDRARHGLRIRYTLEEALAAYLGGAARALKDYAGLLSKARLIRASLEGEPLDRAPEVAQRIIADGLASGLTPATINRRLALLRRLCNLAYQWGWLDAPLGTRIKLLAEHQERHVYLTVDEVERLARSCSYPGARDAILLAAYTGLRRGEILALGPGNVRGDLIMLDGNTKNARPRIVPIPDQVQDIAARLPVAITASSLREDFERARTAAKLPHVRFHDLRHSYASWLVQAGADLRIVKELLGHSTIQVTTRYAHLRSEDLISAVGRLASPGRHKGS